MSVELHQIYKCDVCGIVVQVLDAGAGEPVCCGQPMTLQVPNAHTDHGEMHWILAQRAGEQLLVKVGAEPHPMEAGHFIQWIEARGGPWAVRRDLLPGQPPEMLFHLPADCPDVTVRAFCTRHGLWQTAS